jgi:tetratricopeptide (TPR) repeat protein
MMISQQPICSSSNSVSSDTSYMDDSSSSTLSYKHQPTSTLSDRHLEITQPQHVYYEQESEQQQGGNPVYNQVMQDLRKARRTYGDNHSKVAEAWNALGLVRIHMQRDVEGAQCCHQQALRIFQDLQMKKETAITLVDLGYCCERMGQRDNAMQKYQQALEILDAEQHPESHPQVISTKRAISRMLRR